MTEYTYKYPRPALTVDMIIAKVVNEKLQVLLIQRLNSPYKNKWAFPGGFVDMDETLEQAAARELAEETGVVNVNLKQFKAYSTVNRDPRGRTVSVAFTGKVNGDVIAKAGDDAKNTDWFDINNLPQLAFDHNEILAEILNSNKVF